MLGLLFSLQAPHFTPDDRVALLTDLKQSLQDFQPKNFVQTRSSNDTALDTDDELSRDNQRMIEKCAIFVLEALDQGDLDDSQLLQIYDGVITRMKPLKAVPRNEGGSPVSSVTAASDEAIPIQDANSVAETAESDEAVRLPETMS